MQKAASLRTLLLNSSYEPMRIVSWQKALVLWFQEKVDVLEYHSVFARSMQMKFQLPSVLRLKSYVKPKSHLAVRFCRENVYIRDNFTCQYCGDRLSPKYLTLDHVLPAAQKGEKSWTNMVCACRACNQKKGNRTPQKANMPLLREPKVPNWLPTLQLEIAEDRVPADWAPYLQLKIG